MLTIFRNIRKGLLGQNAILKYIFYALGEIALVVIGILIALQINNWNEKRILSVEINASLIRLQSDLKIDQALFEGQIGVLSEMIQSARRIQQMLLKENTLDDLPKIRAESLSPRNFDYTTSTYEALVNTGLLYQIEDEDLGKQITEYYRQLEDLREIMGRFNDELSRFKTREVSDPFTFLYDTKEGMLPGDLDALIWMNNSSSSTFYAAQVFLANYINKYQYMQNRIQDGHLPRNMSLSSSIENFLK